ncbi:MAG TPA: chemotaxis protein CheA, partial [Vibrio sp.]|nr:chemotaxis protein CheA [Vibrio sp.]
MSYDLDEDILQDFLVEAGEILELLSEQLVELENNPNDKDLLNAIFRGFHTVKGGAGFLSLTELVDTCHGAENVFDILRNGQREVNASLMDTMLRALDTVNEQFKAVQDLEQMEAADQSLLDELHRLSKPASEDEVNVAPVEPEIIIEQPAPVVEAAPVVEQSSQVDAGSIDEITQDEFEKLLDELHGVGSAPNAAPVAPAPAPSAPQPSSESGDITDDEFEKLLDELHGVGHAPGKQEPTPA